MSDKFLSIADHWMRRYEEEYLDATPIPLEQSSCLAPQQILESTAMQSNKPGSACLWTDSEDFPIGLDPVVVSAIRARKTLKLTQMSFSRRLGISVRTLRDWEQGRRQPSGAACSLLALVGSHPEIWFELHQHKVVGEYDSSVL